MGITASTKCYQRLNEHPQAANARVVQAE